VDDVERMLWRKAVEFTKDKKCCTVYYPVGYALRSQSDLLNAIKGCKIAFVMFFGKLCPYCAAFEPIFKHIGSKYNKYANFVKADIEIFYEVAIDLGIGGTPTTVAFVEGRPADLLPGFAAAPVFEKFVRSHISNICPFGRGD